MAETKAGIQVDAKGVAVVDPTENVKALVIAENKRQDDLREAERRYNDLRDTHSKEMNDLRATHLALVRQVDREDQAKTAAAANVAILALAKQTTDLATTLSAQGQAAAAAAETRRSADNAETNKRLSALELSGSASAGKQTITDPQVQMKLASQEVEIQRLVASMNTRSGFDAGKAAAVGAGVLGAGTISALIMKFMIGQ